MTTRRWLILILVLAAGLIVLCWGLLAAYRWLGDPGAEPSPAGAQVYPTLPSATIMVQASPTPTLVQDPTAMPSPTQLPRAEPPPTGDAPTAAPSTDTPPPPDTPTAPATACPGRKLPSVRK